MLSVCFSCPLWEVSCGDFSPLYGRIISDLLTLLYPFLFGLFSRKKKQAIRGWLRDAECKHEVVLCRVPNCALHVTQMTNGEPIIQTIFFFKSYFSSRQFKKKKKKQEKNKC